MDESLLVKIPVFCIILALNSFLNYLLGVHNLFFFDSVFLSLDIKLDSNILIIINYSPPNLN